MNTSTKSDVRFSHEFGSELERLLAWRRDVRRFRSDPLPEGLLAQLVSATRYAPSVGYSQPSRFVRVDDETRRAAVIAEYERCNASAAASYDGERLATYKQLKLAGLREAPVHLAVFADTATSRGQGLGRRTMPETLAQSAVIAVHTLWLVARAKGVGVGWVSILEPAAVTRILSVPEDWKLVAYLCLGYPQEEHEDRELARAGWESHDPASTELLQR